MAKRNIILLISTCLLVGVFAVGTHSQTRSPNQPRDRDSILRDAQQRREQIRSEQARRIAEFNSPARKRALEEELKERRKRAAEIMRELLKEKAALQASEQQWERIKARLLEIRRLRRRTWVGVEPPSSSARQGDGQAGVGAGWQWDRSWGNYPPEQLIEGEKLVDKIIRRLDAPRADEKELTEIMDALRRTKREAQDQVLKIQQELRKELTVRQQAALMLMEWL